MDNHDLLPTSKRISAIRTRYDVFSHPVCSAALLHDFILGNALINANGRTSGYADRVSSKCVAREGILIRRAGGRGGAKGGWAGSSSMQSHIKLRENQLPQCILNF